jgi:hypothetical protein
VTKVADKLKFHICLSIALLCLCIALYNSAQGAVIINEIMANEPGSETALEWIELHNTGVDAVKLSDCFIIEGGDTTRFLAGTSIAAGAFAVLSRKPTAGPGLTSFESTWGNGSGIWGDAANEYYLLLAVKISLRNTCDTITLIMSSGGYRETVIWSTTQPDGVTLERINPFKPASADNFGVCKALSGSTPGRVNSLIPPDNNLTIVTSSSGITTPSDTSQPITLSVRIANRGLKESQPAILLSYFDRDFGGGLSGDDVIDSIALPAILPDSVVHLVREYRESPGRKRLILQLPTDADSTDNILSFDFGFGHLFRELAINEFVPNPDDQSDCEWIELKNVATYPVGLAGFAVGDASRCYTIDADVAILPSQRVIVCQDTAAFLNHFGSAGCAVVQSQGWQRLDNLGDIIIVENDLRSLSDSVQYSGSPEVGFSWERDEDSTAGAFVSLFYQSTDSSGATPCRSNSLRKLPPRNDIGFVSGIAIQTASDQEPVHFVASIRNCGYLTSLASELRLYDDRDYDSVAEEGELFEQATIPAIPAGDSLTVEMSHSFARGYHVVIGILDADDNVTNNTTRTAFSVGPLTGEIVITEFLANPQAALETEWVELENVSSRTIDLHGWMIGDLQHQYGLEQSVVVSPRQYFVIAQDTAAFRRFYGEDCLALQPSKWSNLNNAGDVFVLLDNNGVISDSLTYRELGDNNQSMELDEQDTLSGRRWSVCDSLTGSTPCRENSIHPLLPRNDLCLAEDGIVIESAVDSASVALAITIRNCGSLTSFASEFRLYHDLDLDGVAEDTELVEQRAVSAIAVGDSLVLKVSHPFTRGYHAVIGVISADDNVANNVSRAAFSVGPLTGEIIVTEFLANPETTLETEWAETKNVSSRTVNIHGWTIGDSLHQYTIEQDVQVSPGQYVVLVQDSAAFGSFYGNGCLAIQPSNWASLNNTGDVVILRDNHGVISDSLTFMQVGDGNHSIELNEKQTSSTRSWYVSTSASGSTPCGANSVTSEFTQEINVTLLNRVFSPRSGERLCYHVSCPPATVFVIEVFDLAGRKHWTIANSFPMSTGDYFYDGQSEQYGSLPPGAYILKIEVEDGKTFSRKIGFAVADAK